jgi:nitrogen fixation protein FixH
MIRSLLRLPLPARAGRGRSREARSGEGLLNARNAPHPNPLPASGEREEIAARAEPIVLRPNAGIPVEKRLTGRTVLLYVLAFFGVIIGVNLLMMKLAIDTMPGLEVDSSYRAGNVYNAEIAAAKSQSAREWQVAGHLRRGADGRALLEVEARDRGGAPLTGLVFSAHLERPIDKRADRSVALLERGSGIYRGEAENLAPGQWDVVIEAERGSERLFLSKNRVELK